MRDLEVYRPTWKTNFLPPLLEPVLYVPTRRDLSSRPSGPELAPTTAAPTPAAASVTKNEPSRLPILR